jgi:hypothetical protein
MPPLPRKYGLNVARPHPPPMPLTELNKFFMLLILVLTRPVDEEEDGFKRVVIALRMVVIPDATNLPAVETSKLGWKS